ncbi:hypothetical protein CEY16_05550 [Halalkalibacillus sediminis]|uniref:TRASH domain-containing protein n=1 Tax=Halalkalibacillus sediminis TaxID=2018042 RepID=A0A2I0QXY8_9BACI|nr:hypothetical protein [Halalkalibacillus sediminis]PKR79206.1 hypothetical protein CEY16_05550 [Halalkalibacillus sediminis]
MGLENPLVTNMDRVNMPNSEKECESCHETLYSGYEDVKLHEGEYFCDEECLKNHLLENATYEEVTL